MSQLSTVILVSFNSKALLPELKQRLYGCPIIIVDNASTDGSVEWLQQEWPEAQLIANTLNEGYGRAINRAMKQVTSPYAMVVNPDLSIVSVQLDALTAVAESIDDDFLFIAPNTGEQPKYLGSSDKTLREIKWASGSAMFFKRVVFERLQGFDENIFLFFEETDLCRRAEKQKIPMYYAEKISCPHGIGESVELTDAIERLKIWHFEWSRLYYLKKHGDFLALTLKLLKILLSYPFKLVFCRLTPSKRIVYGMRLSAVRRFLSGHTAFCYTKLEWFKPNDKGC